MTRTPDERAARDAAKARERDEDRKDPLPQVTVALKNSFAKQLARDLGEVVSVVESVSGISSQWTTFRHSS